jgi:putative phosphoesterase
MKIALIGDIHANLPALEAVLAHIENLGAKKIWNLGDSVGYGPFPNKVVQILRKDDRILSILGNYDRQVLKFKKKRNKWRKSKHPDKYTAFEWAYENLSKKNRKYLRFLSKEVRVKVRGHRILLAHGSPASDKEHLYPDTPEDRLRELAKMAKKTDIIVVGHSHQPFVRQVDDVWFINTGSVGRPDDGDPRACYAILRFQGDEFQVQHHRVEYDVERTVAAVQEHNLPETFAQMFLQGHSLDYFLPEGGDGEEEEEEEEE